jgi:hypothetical protein
VRYSLILVLVSSPLSPAAAQLSHEVRVGSVRVPLAPGAMVVPHPHGQGRLGGTRVRLEDRLTVELAARPASPTPLMAYVDSVVASRNAGLRPAWRIDPPTALIVAGRTVWVVRPRCGDCDAVEAYIDFPGTRLVVAWGVDGLEGLTIAQRHALAWRFIETLTAADQAS